MIFGKEAYEQQQAWRSLRGRRNPVVANSPVKVDSADCQKEEESRKAGPR
jgi:hypothetical protein